MVAASACPKIKDAMYQSHYNDSHDAHKNASCYRMLSQIVNNGMKV